MSEQKDTKYIHTNIIAKDWRKLAKFYEKVLGCVYVPPERKLSGSWLSKGTGIRDADLEGCHLRFPGIGEDGPTLEIFSYKEMSENRPPVANRLGLGHLAFSVGNVPEMLEKIIANGGEALGEIVCSVIPGYDKIVFVYASDPEGNILEIQQKS